MKVLNNEKNQVKRRKTMKEGGSHLLVPTLWLGAMSMVSVAES